jgi:hypothetical protein
MNTPYPCSACRNVIPSAVTHIVNENAAIICVRCAEDPATHEVLYPDCAVNAHAVLDHPVIVGTKLGAHRPLLHLWAVTG